MESGSTKPKVVKEELVVWVGSVYREDTKTK